MKTAVSFVDLGTRDANVHENAVDLRDAKFRKFSFISEKGA